jgi:internalin A
MKRQVFLTLVVVGALTVTAFAEEPVYFADPNFKSAVESALGKTNPTPTDMLELTELHAERKGITNFTGLEYATNLTFLYAWDNLIVDLSPLAGLRNLERLNLSGNQITDLSPLAGLTSLTSLEMEINSITDINPLSGLTNLTELALGQNSITDISPLSRLTKLTTLNIPFNSITDISPLSGLTNLTYLKIIENQITDISPLAGLTNLTGLGLMDNRITDISPLAGLTNLSSLNLETNNITDISPLSGLTNMTELTLGRNSITDLSPLSRLTKLTALYLSYNNSITDISPLSGLTNLTNLKIVGNPLTDISPLAGLTNLTGELGLSDNHISDISPLVGLVNLGKLHLEGNQITDISPLAGLVNLVELHLDRNRISDLSRLAGFTKMQILSVNSNPLNNEAYCIYLPLIKANNPSLSSLDYSPNTNPPKGVSASDGLYPDRVRITWDAKCNGPNYSTTFYYRVHRDTSAIPGRGTIPLGSWQIGTTFYDTSARPGVTYFYWVTSATDINGSNQTAYSEPDTGFLMGPTLVVSSTQGGRVTNPGEGTFHYANNTTIQVAITADPNYHFIYWTGTAVDANKVADINIPETTVVVDSNYTLVANFESEMDTLFVGQSGLADPNADGTQQHPFGQVQEAIEVAPEGGQLVIGSGMYAGPLDLLGKGIELTGLEDPTEPNKWSWPVIDAQDSGPVVSFTHDEDSNCILRGLILTGGKGDKAGAIYCCGSGPTILNCLIVGNRVNDPNGGAVYCQDSNAVLVNCTIADNYGGASGAGIYVLDSNVTLWNSIVWGNDPAEITVAHGPEPTVIYSNITGGWLGTGNMSLDPLFVLPGHWEDPAEPNALWIPGDYHLMSTVGRWDPTSQSWVIDAVTSLCIDAGDPNSTVGDEPSPNGGRINMGAFGGTAEASKSPAN